MRPAQGTDVPLDFPRNRIVREDANGTGGGGGMDNLERRVTTLEEDVKLIRTDLTTLMVRSESFATKADISDIRTEMAESRGSIRQEMAESRGELKAEMAALRGELKAAMFETKQSILTAIDDKSRWKWGSVFIPLGVGILGALATLLVAHLSG